MVDAIKKKSQSLRENIHIIKKPHCLYKEIIQINNLKNFNGEIFEHILHNTTLNDAQPYY